jgi:hypothetical protein
MSSPVSPKRCTSTCSTTPVTAARKKHQSWRTPSYADHFVTPNPGLLRISLSRSPGVRVYFKSPLESVEVDGTMLRAATFANNLTVRADQWIDASYEGRCVGGAKPRRVFGTTAHHFNDLKQATSWRLQACLLLSDVRARRSTTRMSRASVSRTMSPITSLQPTSMGPMRAASSFP